MSSHGHLFALSEEQPGQSFVFHKINFQFLEMNFKNKRTVRALFAFCLALVAYNAVAVIKAALRRAHGKQQGHNEVSSY